jgi:hypothetical protein
MEDSSVLEVHAPHRAAHTVKDFLLHIAAISIGLLLALGLESTVEWLHHRHQGSEALHVLRREVERNRLILAADIASADAAEGHHRAALAVVHRVRAGQARPGDQVIFIRRYLPLNSSAWKVVHDTGAAAYIPYEVLATYGDVYESQTTINEMAQWMYAELLKATSVLNSEQPVQNRAEEDRLQRSAEANEIEPHERSGASDLAADQKLAAQLSGAQELDRLSSAQLDRLEQGFQEAISNDRRLHRRFINLDTLYASLLSR